MDKPVRPEELVARYGQRSIRKRNLVKPVILTKVDEVARRC